jgi:hypothetical protein
MFVQSFEGQAPDLTAKSSRGSCRTSTQIVQINRHIQIYIMPIIAITDRTRGEEVQERRTTQSTGRACPRSTVIISYVE